MAVAPQSRLPSYQPLRACIRLHPWIQQRHKRKKWVTFASHSCCSLPGVRNIARLDRVEVIDLRNTSILDRPCGLTSARTKLMRNIIPGPSRETRREKRTNPKFHIPPPALLVAASSPLILDPPSCLLNLRLDCSHPPSSPSPSSPLRGPVRILLSTPLPALIAHRYSPNLQRAPSTPHPAQIEGATMARRARRTRLRGCTCRTRAARLARAKARDSPATGRRTGTRARDSSGLRG